MGMAYRMRTLAGPGLGLLVAGALVAALASAAATAQEVTVRTELRVCADPNLMPFSNDAREGFENKLAQKIADELEIPIVYTWWPQTIGFVRNTLAARNCDLVMGTVSGEALMQNTNAYYRSVYTMVYRADSEALPTTLTDPALEAMRIGVVARTPPATLLALYGLTNIQPYQLNVDTRADNPARRAIEDVADGAVDVALMWGPIAGFYAHRQSPPLVVVPMLNEPGPTPLQFRITMGIRRDEPDWRHWLNDFIRDNQDDIDRLLVSYHVPILDPAGNLIVVDGQAAP